MIQMKTILQVADNTGARTASVIGVLNAKGKLHAQIGDIVRVNVKESTPDAAVPTRCRSPSDASPATNDSAITGWSSTTSTVICMPTTSPAFTLNDTSFNAQINSASLRRPKDINVSRSVLYRCRGPSL